MFRLLRVFRLLRDLGFGTIWTILVRDRANSMLMTLLLFGVLVLQFGSLSVLAVEVDAEGASITTASDALWYTIVTISTVGYGDHYPVTQAGMLIGTLIIVIGVGIFGTFTGYLANLFLGPSRRADAVVADTAAHGDGSLAFDPDHRAEAAAIGVAAGAVSGAVTVGASEPGVPASAHDDAARLESLLAQSEQLANEIRELLAAHRQDGTGASDADTP